MYDIVSIGEALIDFTPAGFDSSNNPLYTQNAGGAPLNLLAMAAKLNCSTALITQVGDDIFGHFLLDKIKETNISTKGVILSKEYLTTLAFVTLDNKGDRSFSFYRDRSADVMLNKKDVNKELLKSCKIFHFGSLSMTNEICKSATMMSILYAKENNAIISYDPNYRPLLWKSEADAIDVMKSVIKHVDIIKLSEEELYLLTANGDLEERAGEVSSLGPRVVIVTLGSNGSFIYTKSIKKHYRSYLVDCVDTTGAGDAFFGSFLSNLINDLHISQLDDLDQLSEERVDKYMSFSNAAGALTITKHGAIPALPTKDEIINCMKDYLPEIRTE